MSVPDKPIEKMTTVELPVSSGALLDRLDEISEKLP